MAQEENKVVRQKTRIGNALVNENGFFDVGEDEYSLLMKYKIDKTTGEPVLDENGNPVPNPNLRLVELLNLSKPLLTSDVLVENNGKTALFPRFGVLSIAAKYTAIRIYDHPVMTKYYPTAFTDGTSVFINAELFKNLAVEDRQLGTNNIEFLILHELSHKIKNHDVLLRNYGSKYSNIINVGCDILINSKLQVFDRSLHPGPGLNRVGLAMTSEELAHFEAALSSDGGLGGYTEVAIIKHLLENIEAQKLLAQEAEKRQQEELKTPMPSMASVGNSDDYSEDNQSQSNDNSQDGASSKNTKQKPQKDGTDGQKEESNEQGNDGQEKPSEEAQQGGNGNDAQNEQENGSQNGVGNGQGQQNERENQQNHQENGNGDGENTNENAQGQENSNKPQRKTRKQRGSANREDVSSLGDDMSHQNQQQNNGNGQGAPSQPGQDGSPSGSGNGMPGGTGGPSGSGGQAGGGGQEGEENEHGSHIETMEGLMDKLVKEAKNGSISPDQLEKLAKGVWGDKVAKSLKDAVTGNDKEAQKAKKELRSALDDIERSQRAQRDNIQKESDAAVRNASGALSRGLMDANDFFSVSVANVKPPMIDFSDISKTINQIAGERTSTGIPIDELKNSKRFRPTIIEDKDGNQIIKLMPTVGMAARMKKQDVLVKPEWDALVVVDTSGSMSAKYDGEQSDKHNLTFAEFSVSCALQMLKEPYNIDNGIHRIFLACGDAALGSLTVLDKYSVNNSNSLSIDDNQMQVTGGGGTNLSRVSEEAFDKVLEMAEQENKQIRAGKSNISVCFVISDGDDATPSRASYAKMLNDDVKVVFVVPDGSPMSQNRVDWAQYMTLGSQTMLSLDGAKNATKVSINRGVEKENKPKNKPSKSKKEKSQSPRAS